MEYYEYSFRYAKEIITSENFNELYKEITDVCKEMPIFTFSGKSKKQTNKDVVQQMLNQYIKLRLTQKGWEPEPSVSNNDSNSLRGDFQKSIEYTVNIGGNSKDEVKEFTVMVEVEFGNAASYYRDLFKFQHSFASIDADLCVLIVPTQALSQRIDSGLGDFEKVMRELPQVKQSTTVPILVIGLQNDINAELDLSQYMKVDVAKKTDKNNVAYRNYFLNSVIDNKYNPNSKICKITKKAKIMCMSKIIDAEYDAKIERIQKEIDTNNAILNSSQNKKEKESAEASIKRNTAKIIKYNKERDDKKVKLKNTIK